MESEINENVLLRRLTWKLEENEGRGTASGPEMGLKFYQMHFPTGREYFAGHFRMGEGSSFNRVNENRTQIEV